MTADQMKKYASRVRRQRRMRRLMLLMLLALAVSTVLNVLYLMKTVITLYRPARDGFTCVVEKTDTAGICAMVGFVVLNVLLGVLAQPVLNMIRNGLQLFV